jgi:cell cycle checkpoint control protein RAD9A
MSSLKFVLSASAAQRVHDILSCLSKFSEYVCLEARRNRFTLSALNSTKSAYGGISLSSGEFFESYSFEATGSNESTEPPRFTCRLYSKVTHCLDSEQDEGRY